MMKKMYMLFLCTMSSMTYQDAHGMARRIGTLARTMNHRTYGTQRLLDPEAKAHLEGLMTHAAKQRTLEQDLKTGHARAEWGIAGTVCFSGALLTHAACCNQTSLMVVGVLGFSALKSLDLGLFPHHTAPRLQTELEASRRVSASDAYELNQLRGFPVNAKKVAGDLVSGCGLTRAHAEEEVRRLLAQCKPAETEADGSKR